MCNVLLVINVEFERMLLLMLKGSVIYVALATTLLVSTVLGATLKASANADVQSIRTTATARLGQQAISSTQPRADAVSFFSFKVSLDD